MRQLKVLTFLIISIIFSASYALPEKWWWRFPVTTIIIVLSTRLLIPGHDWKKTSGIKLTNKDFAIFMIIFVCSSILIYALRKHYSLQQNIYSTGYGVPVLAGLIFEVFNEELIFRALLLTLLSGVFSKNQILSFLVAFIFVLLHFVLYKYLNPQKTGLSPQTLFSLFFITLAWNNFYFLTGKIHISLALHLSWNTQIFGLRFFSDNQVFFSEPRVFNYFVGLPVVFIFNLILCIISFILLYKPRTWGGVIEKK